MKKSELNRALEIIKEIDRFGELLKEPTIIVVGNNQPRSIGVCAETGNIFSEIQGVLRRHRAELIAELEALGVSYEE